MSNEELRCTYDGANGEPHSERPCERGGDVEETGTLSRVPCRLHAVFAVGRAWPVAVGKCTSR